MTVGTDLLNEDSGNLGNQVFAQLTLKNLYTGKKTPQEVQCDHSQILSVQAPRSGPGRRLPLRMHQEGRSAEQLLMLVERSVHRAPIAASAERWDWRTN